MHCCSKPTAIARMLQESGNIFINEVESLISESNCPQWKLFQLLLILFQGGKRLVKNIDEVHKAVHLGSDSDKVSISMTKDPRTKIQESLAGWCCSLMTISTIYKHENP